MKPNAEQSDREFAYTVACKRMMNDCALMQDEVDTAKRTDINGQSYGAMIGVEIALEILRQSIINALKTV
jgi:hypothetical protein